MAKLEKDDAQAIAEFFRQRICMPIHGQEHSTVWNRIDTRDADEATNIVEAIENGDDWIFVARLIVRILVDEAMNLRMIAYHSPSFDHSRSTGGFICRMLLHDQSPDADRLDRLALAVANNIPGLSQEERLNMML